MKRIPIQKRLFEIIHKSMRRQGNFNEKCWKASSLIANQIANNYRRRNKNMKGSNL